MSQSLVKALGHQPSPEHVRRVVEELMLDFFERDVNPNSMQRDEECVCLSPRVFEQAARIGLVNFLLPAEVGGLDGSRRTFGLLLEQISYYCEDMAFPSILAMFADIPNVILQAGRPDLVEEYVVPMSQGRRFATFAFTDYGEPLFFETRVRSAGDKFLLSGEKTLQTGGALADTFLTYTRDENDDIKIFLVEKDDPGVEVSPVPTLGLRSAGLTRMVLTDVELPSRRLLFGSDGLSQSQLFLNDRRLFIVCPFVGAMKFILERCIKHLNTVIREGKPLTEMQAVQSKIGQMAIRYQTARAVLHNALDRAESNEINPLFDPVISAAKYFITEQAIALADRAVRLTGWRGYSKKLPFERYLRALMAGVTGQTAQDILEIHLGVNAIAEIELAGHKRTEP
ncbi:MAG: acyl-CoA/acyl-ACP dehydrogenase [Proteobacteria bacterium]|nr:acyl-CoA/acyl-ACP dehydrogenase [Pseudomonadota bacterium]